MSQNNQSNRSNTDVDEGAGAGAGTVTGASQDTSTAPPPSPPLTTAPVVAASGRTCAPRADSSDRFDARGRAWCEYHGRFAPSHSTRYCAARYAHERRELASRRTDERIQATALRMLENIASGRSSSSGGIQKPRAQGKGKRKNQDKNSRLAAVVDKIAKLKAEKGSSKNLPARGPLKKDPNDDEGGPDSGAAKQITV